MIVSRIAFLTLMAVNAFHVNASNTDRKMEADANIASTNHISEVDGPHDGPNFFYGGFPLESKKGNDVTPLSSGRKDLTEAMIESIEPPEAQRRHMEGKKVNNKKKKRRKKAKKKKRRKNAKKKKTTITATTATTTTTTTTPTTTTTTPTTGPEGKGTFMYRSAANTPFPIEMTYFTSAIVEGYSNCSDLREDILAAARIQANAVILEQAKNDVPIYKFREELDTIAAPEAVPEAEFTADASEGFETNNQVKDVHEADIIKSNGKEIYAAYGDKVVVLNVTGELLSKIVMPVLDDLGDCKPPPPIPIIRPLLEDQEDSEGEEESTEKTIVAEPKSMIIGPPIKMGPKVRSLLLHGNRLAVVVESWRYWCYSEHQPILSDYGRAQIRLYDISDPTNLVLVGTKNLQGSYREARRIDRHAYFVSVTHVNTWSITGPLYRWRSEFSLLNSTEYIAKATEIATKTTEDFADRLIKEMEVKDLDCANIARISMMETGNRTEDEDDVDSSYVNGIINGYAQVTTVDLQHDHGNYTSHLNGTNTTLLAHLSGIFLRTSWVEVYASKSMLVLFGTGYRWNFRSSTQTTYLCAFSLRNDTAKPAAIGSVPGDLLDQFSIDHKDNYLRVASTEIGPWEWFNETDEEGNTFGRWASETNNRITVLEFPDDTVDNGAYNNSVLNEVGFIDGLGKRFERIFAVRYVGDMAYVVTFLQTDPFYIIDMSDATKPTRVGELNITGFSNYLHPVDDNTLLAVGQEANERGVAIGLQVSMFDVSNSSDPGLLTRYTVEEDDESWSWSDAQFEHKAFRYLKSLQKLILPARISGKNAFDGFLVFGVNETHIEPEFNISHTRTTWWCHYNAYLQARSIVVGRKVTTFKGHTIKNYDLTTRNESWSVDLGHCVY